MEFLFWLESGFGVMAHAWLLHSAPTKQLRAHDKDSGTEMNDQLTASITAVQLHMSVVELSLM